MKVISILSMFLYVFSAFSAFAKNSEKPDDYPGELKFLPGVSEYIEADLEEVNGVRIRGEPVNRMFLRPLTEFKVGTKYCLHSSKNWDERCQDAAMKYAFGKDWREFKRVLLAFITLMQKPELRNWLYDDYWDVDKHQAEYIEMAKIIDNQKDLFEDDNIICPRGYSVAN